MAKKRKFNAVGWTLTTVGAILLFLSYLVWQNPEKFHAFIVATLSDSFGVALALLLGGIFWLIFRRNIS